MSDTTNISWTDKTFNPWIGCTKVHTGCKNCYAEADMDNRRGRVQWGPTGTRSMTKTWGDPVKWNRRWEVYRTVWDQINEAAPIATSHLQLARHDKFEIVNEMFEHGLLEANEGNLGGLLPKPWRNCRVFCASLADVFEDWKGGIRNHIGEVLRRDRSLNVVTTEVSNALKRGALKATMTTIGTKTGKMTTTSDVKDEHAHQPLRIDQSHRRRKVSEVIRQNDGCKLER